MGFGTYDEGEEQEQKIDTDDLKQSDKMKRARHEGQESLDGEVEDMMKNFTKNRHE